MHRYDSMDKAVLSPVWRSVVPYTIFFSHGYSFVFFLNFPNFMVDWGFGVVDLDLVFGVRVFSWWGLGPVVSGFPGFSGLGLFT